MEENKINYEFDYDGETYIADVQHYAGLSKEDIAKYQVTENTFLVHLFATTKGITSFELFMDEDMDWTIHPSIDIHPEIVQIIGLKIHDSNM